MTCSAVLIAALSGYAMPRFVWIAVALDGIAGWLTLYFAWLR